MDDHARTWAGFEHTEGWGHPQYKIRSKMVAWTNEPGTEPVWACLCATKDEQEALVNDPAVEPAPYAHKHGWVKVTVTDEATLELAKELLDRAREHVVSKLPKYVQRELENEQSPQP